MTTPIEGVRSVGLATPDLDLLVTFYRDEWGLVPVASSPGLVHLGAAGSREPFVLRLRQADEARFDLVSLAVDSQVAVDQLFGTVVHAGTRVITEPADLDQPGGGYGFRCFDTDGNVLELSSDMEAMAPLAAPFAGAPESLSHLVWNSQDPEALSCFYCDVLGFRVADYLEDKLTFLRTNEVHHRVAIARSPFVGLNHAAFECADIDAYLRATGRLVRRGRTLLWGPGRHGPGDNTYAYFTDPAGFICEYTTGLEILDEDHEPRTWRSKPEESDLWGLSNARPNEAMLGWPDPGRWVAPPV